MDNEDELFSRLDSDGRRLEGADGGGVASPLYDDEHELNDTEDLLYDR